MDKKKLLLVAASVGMFLVIVFGAAILVFTPRTKTDTGVISGTSDWTPPSRVEGTAPAGGAPAGYTEPPPAGIVPPGWTQDSSGQLVQSGQGIQMPPRTGYETAEGFNGGYNVHGGAGAGSAAYGDTGAYGEPRQPAAGRDSGGRTIISVPSPVNAGVPQTAANVRSGAERPISPPVEKEAPVVRTQAKPAAVKKPVETVEAVKRTGYWVQTGSYVKKSSADNAKDFLNTKGIASIVTNTNIDGRTFYRVRVGPYVSKNEADYWLSLIKTINGMENSQIWKNGTL